MNTDPNQVAEDVSSQIPPQNAVKLFDPTAGAGDFPVLKAFQEYLETEQAKARKRMLGLSIFFIVLLVVVVVTFTLIMSTVINRNQALSDRLLDIALRERQPVSQPAPVVNVQQPAPHIVQQPTPTQPAADAMKPLMEKLEQLIAEKQKSASVPPATTPEQAKIVAETQAMLQQQAELKRQQDAVKAEKEKLKAEQEKLHQEQVEQHRRRLYPEYYAQKDAQEAAKSAAKSVPQLPAVKTEVPDVKTEVPVRTIPATAKRPSKKLLDVDEPKADVNDDKIPPLPKNEFDDLDEDLKELIRQSQLRQRAAAKSTATTKPAAPVEKKNNAIKSKTKPDSVKEEAKTATDKDKKSIASTSAVNTVTLKVNTSNSNSIPWIVEMPAAPKAK